MKLIALIDGGGTKTRVRFLNQADQTVVSEVVTGPSNLGLGAEVCWQQIMQAITLASVPVPVKCLAGLAGSEYAKQRSAFLFNPPCETLLVSDRDSGLFGAHCGMPGGCLTVGTGVAFSWLDESRHLLRRGGYGFTLADQGGGAWIGLRFMQELVRLVDRGLIDKSHQSLIDRLAIGQSVTQWMEFANAAQPQQFASLAKTIVEAESQVSLSADIVSEGLMALIDLIQDFPKHLPIALVGGLSAVYSPRIQSLGYRVVEPQGDALDGLAYIDQHRQQLTIDYWESYA